MSNNTNMKKICGYRNMMINKHLHLSLQQWKKISGKMLFRAYTFSWMIQEAASYLGISVFLSAEERVFVCSHKPSEFILVILT